MASLFKGIKSHGLFFADGAPLHVEIRATDPTIVPGETEVGRIWFNSTENTFKYTKKVEENVVISSFDSEASANLAKLIADLASQEVAKGTDLIGVKELVSTDTTITFAAGTLTDTLLKTIDKLAEIQVDLATKLSKTATETQTVAGPVTFTSAVTLNATPTSDTDAVTKAYVDAKANASAAGIDAKESVRIATTENVTLATITEIDGVTLAVGDRVLVKDQTTKTENGIYVLGDSGLERASDAVEGKLTSAAFCFVTEGTKWKGTGWKVATIDKIVVGTTDIEWAQFTENSVYSSGDGLNLTGTKFSVQIPESEKRLISDTTGVHISTEFNTELETLRTDIDAINTNVGSSSYSYISDTAKTNFTITHNLNTLHVIPIVWVKDDVGTFYKNDLIDMKLVDKNTLDIVLVEAKNILVNITISKPPVVVAP